MIDKTEMPKNSQRGSGRGRNNVGVHKIIIILAITISMVKMILAGKELLCNFVI